MRHRHLGVIPFVLLLMLGAWALPAKAAPAHLQCGQEITTDVVLDSDLVNCDFVGIVVGGDGEPITIDLAGHTVDGIGQGFGITGQRSFTVENGSIRQFETAVDPARASAVVSHVVVTGNGAAATITHSRVTIQDSWVVGNRIGVSGGLLSDGLTVTDSVVANNRTDGIASSTDTVIRDSVIAANGGSGIRVGEPGEPSGSALIEGNMIQRNGADGIVAFGAAAVMGNRVNRNGDDGIDVRGDATVSGNRTWWNGDHGIQALPSTGGGANWAKHNGSRAQCIPASLCSTKGRPRGKAPKN